MAESIITQGAPATTSLTVSTTPTEKEAKAKQNEEISKSINGAGVKNPALDTNYNIAAFPEVGSNPLNKYVTYNCLLTLSCLNKEEQNAGKFDKSKIKNIIARTQGDWKNSNNRVSTEFGQFDYFIDDLIIVTQPAISTKTNESFATKITFKIIEPYSMGLFLNAMLVGAQDSGYGNFREASYLLMLEFVGYTDDNKPRAADPSLTRYIPIRFIDIKFSVKSSGSVYECEVIPYNELAFRSPITNTKTDIGLSGTTVKELLVSLQDGLNEFAKKSVKDKEVDSADEYEIHFPENFTDTKDSGNDISKAIVFKGNETGSISFPDLDNVYVPSQHIITSRNLGKIDKKTYHFNQNTKIQDIISEVVIRSDYIINQLTNDSVKSNKKGMINWFRIEIQVRDGKESNTHNRQTRKYTFRVVPYEVHLSKLLPPNAIPYGYEELKKTVNRIYNYIYTGKNTEIINFDIDFNMSFFSKVYADAGNNPGTNNRNLLHDAGGQDRSERVKEANAPIKGEQGTSVETAAQNRNAGRDGTDTDSSTQVKNYREMLTNPGDMIEVKMTILGDPYYLPNSGFGNQIKNPKGDNIMEDGSMNYQSGEVDIVINFRTPTDLNPVTGLYNFTAKIDQFSGLFRIFEVETKINQNKFTQTITAQRRRTQLRGSGEKSVLLGNV